MYPEGSAAGEGGSAQGGVCLGGLHPRAGGESAQGGFCIQRVCIQGDLPNPLGLPTGGSA